MRLIASPLLGGGVARLRRDRPAQPVPITLQRTGEKIADGSRPAIPDIGEAIAIHGALIYEFGGVATTQFEPG